MEKQIGRKKEKNKPSVICYRILHHSTTKETAILEWYGEKKIVITLQNARIFKQTVSQTTIKRYENIYYLILINL